MKLKGLNRSEILAITSLGVTGVYITLQTDLARAMMGSGEARSGRPRPCGKRPKPMSSRCPLPTC